MIPIAQPSLGKEEVAAAKEAILSGWVSQGPKVREFEKKFAAYVGAPHACAVNSCASALHLALLAVGVKAGDCVLTVSHSFIATANAVSYCGAKPVFIDIDSATFNMSPAALAECLTGQCQKRGDGLFLKETDARVAAVLVVHQIGLPADLKKILEITRSHQIPLVEDAACATGSEISFDGGTTFERIGKPHGDIACFSFHPRKVLTTGEGGMITTNNDVYAGECRLLRSQAMSVSDLDRHTASGIVIETYPKIGYNYRMTDIQAAIGIEQLKKIPAMVKRRRQIAALYQKELKNISWLTLPAEPPYAKSNWQSFAVRLSPNAPRRQKDFMQYLLDNGVSTRPGIMNAHQEEAYASFGGSLSNSESARVATVLIPLFSGMTDRQVQTVIKVIKSV